MAEEITPEDRERVALLKLITNSKHEFNKLSKDQLTRLQELVEKKDYSHSKKAHKSKLKSEMSKSNFQKPLKSILKNKKIERPADENKLR